MIGKPYSENRLSFLTIATASAAVLMMLLLPTLLAPFASAGQLPLSPVSMDPAVFVFTAPEVCGFIPYDISVDIDEPIDTTFAPGVGLNGEPSVFVPELKEGDYATNFFISNSDQQLPTDRITWNLFIEYAGYTLPNGTFIGRPIKRVINMTAELQALTPSRYLALPRNGTLAVGCSTINAYGSLAPRPSDPLFRVNKTDIILRALVAIDPQHPIAPGSTLFWKAYNIWNQTKGDAVDTTAFPLDIDVVYSYESSVNKIWFQILKDPSRTLPRDLIGRNLEIVVASRPLNKTQLGNRWFEVVNIDTLIRTAIRDQYPAAADRVILRVIDVDYGVGSSWQVVESLTFREVPP
ncbi:MAG: hypothetical protein NZ570_02745 [Candidatus Caldarchaeum sp.]|nr:hypothetical protein [Candidatus Caldarchaeum sp.]MDW8359139.1 hypothetical protein [Candidatus Caldarchaeum sp.]